MSDNTETQEFKPLDLCEKCGEEVEVGCWPFCPHESTAPYRPFPAFEYEGQKITDLQQIRRIERETMDRYRGGERIQPVQWRDFSQDRSNRDVNTFGRPDVPGTPKRQNIKLRRRENPND
jgi:hypothetical protein